MRTNAGRDGFLADVGVAGPMNQTALMTARKLFFGPPNELHDSIQAQKLIVRHRSLALCSKGLD
jgi:hypothetical protein